MPSDPAEHQEHSPSSLTSYVQFTQETMINSPENAIYFILLLIFLKLIIQVLSFAHTVCCTPGFKAGTMSSVHGQFMQADTWMNPFPIIVARGFSWHYCNKICPPYSCTVTNVQYSQEGKQIDH